MCTVHNNSDRFWGALNNNSLILLCTLLPCIQTAHSSQCHNIFQKLFPHKLGGQKRECLSWATSHDVAVKVAIITHFGQAASVLTENGDCELEMTSSFEVVSSLHWRKASVVTQVDCQHTSAIARLAVSKLVRAHTRREILQLHSYLQYKYRSTDRVCISFTERALLHKQCHVHSWHLNQQHWIYTVLMATLALSLCIIWKADHCSLRWA